AGRSATLRVTLTKNCSGSRQWRAYGNCWDRAKLPHCLSPIWWRPSALTTRNCSMSCNSWSNANAANSKVGKPKRVKAWAVIVNPGSNADVCPARNRRLADFFRFVLLSAIGAGGCRMALAEAATCDGQDVGRIALRVADSTVSGFPGHHLCLCRAVVSVAGTPFN